MAFDVIPTSERWEKIVNIQDEKLQNRAINKYVYELEQKVFSQESELRELRRRNKEYRKDILSLNIVKDAIRKVKNEAYKECNTDWDGMQNGF